MDKRYATVYIEYLNKEIIRFRDWSTSAMADSENLSKNLWGVKEALDKARDALEREMIGGS